MELTKPVKIQFMFNPLRPEELSRAEERMNRLEYEGYNIFLYGWAGSSDIAYVTAKLRK